MCTRVATWFPHNTPPGFLIGCFPQSTSGYLGTSGSCPYHMETKKCDFIFCGWGGGQPDRQAPSRALNIRQKSTHGLRIPLSYQPRVDPPAGRSLDKVDGNPPPSAHGLASSHLAQQTAGWESRLGLLRPYTVK